MYYKIVDISTDSQVGGFSKVYPVQYLPGIGFVRATQGTFRHIEEQIAVNTNNEMRYFLIETISGFVESLPNQSAEGRANAERILNQLEKEGFLRFSPELSAANRHFAYAQINQPELSLFTHTHRAPTGSNYLARGFFSSLYKPGFMANTGVMPSRTPSSLDIGLLHRVNTGQTIAWRSFWRISAGGLPPMEPYYIGIGRHFDESTGNFYNGNFQGLTPTQNWFSGTSRLTGSHTDERLPALIFFEDGYQITKVDFGSGWEIARRVPVDRNSPRWLTGCPFLNGFETLDLIMLDCNVDAGPDAVFAGN